MAGRIRYFGYHIVLYCIVLQCRCSRRRTKEREKESSRRRRSVSCRTTKKIFSTSIYRTVCRLLQPKKMDLLPLLVTSRCSAVILVRRVRRCRALLPALSHRKVPPYLSSSYWCVLIAVRCSTGLLSFLRSVDPPTFLWLGTDQIVCSFLLPLSHSLSFIRRMRTPGKIASISSYIHVKNTASPWIQLLLLGVYDDFLLLKFNFSKTFLFCENCFERK